MQDLYSFMYLPYAFTAWVAAAFCAPALGPVISAFAVEAKGWRWPFYEILMMSGPVFLIFFFFMPETNAATILLKRARRIRKLTGNSDFKSQSEIDQGELTIGQVVQDSLIKPTQITALDPAGQWLRVENFTRPLSFANQTIVLFTNVYTSLIYGIYYSFFEVFPLV